MDSFKNFLSKFFGVAIRSQTYLNIFYLLLAFPLGLTYFILLVTGISVGIGTVIVWIGLVICLLVFGMWVGLVIFERKLAIWLLREDIPPVESYDLSGKSLLQKLGAYVKNPVTWKGLVYLFAKFPLGIFSFVVLVTLTSVSLGLMAAPMYYQYAHPEFNLSIDYWHWPAILIVDTPFEAAITFLIGAILLFVSLHTFNGLAWISGKFARIMLGYFPPETVSVPPATQPAPVEGISPLTDVTPAAIPPAPQDVSETPVVSQ